MKWISYFFTCNIPFYIYHLKTNDSMIEIYNNKQEKSIIILCGLIYTTKIFSNYESCPIALLHKNNIIDIDNCLQNEKSYYKMTALKETYIIRFSYIHIKDINITKTFFKYYIASYKFTLYTHKMMHYILIQKNTYYRIIQLVTLLSIYFGIINQEFIKIPFKIRKIDIAMMTGSNINTINKTFHILKLKKIIKYSRNKLLLIQKSFFVNFLYLLN
uniref:Global nitrogen transcriptional regulator n=1 Tax=Ceramothamnion japonicum TaxID=218448 RepID=A0A1C9CDI3_CERJP|nr:global nitrogen transcriptional regulator [Ceramium japonicum]AOM66425.1 global nitrogen transcriptional regulator [Ceramium japonicum]